jgi:WD40 repeat protein
MVPIVPTPQPPGTSRAQFVADLAARRSASGKSFAVLARELDHPRSTLHGWCRGDHLPFPRDDEVFARLLSAIGVDDPDPWLDTLRRLRNRAGRENPYRGLEPYTEGDTTHFHGRDALVDRLVEAIDRDQDATAAAHPLVVIGASGSGKTSLLRAGLLGRLRQRPGQALAVVTPGDDPVDRLDRALARITGARAATLVIDQFEELFTIAPESSIDPAVARIATAQRSGIRVVIGVRADFFHHLAAIPYLMVALDRRQVVVGPMSTRELTDAIVTPASMVGLTLTPSLVAHLLQEFDEQEQRSRGTNALPLLSHVLFRLADGAASDLVGLADYEATGGLRDALQQTADDALAGLPTERHDICRQLFLQLVELRADTTPTRRSATRAVLDRLASGDAVSEVLDAFVARRLLTVERDTVTLSHEALLTAWPTLREWVDGQRGQLLVRSRIRSTHRMWEETGEPVDGLLRGSLLDEAIDLLDGPLRSTLDEREQAFIAASTAERDAARVRDAEVLSRQIAAQSDLLGARDPSLSGHLALEAIAVADTVEARSAVLRCVTSAAGPRFVGRTGPSAVATAPAAGRAVAALYASGAVEWFELDGAVPRRVGGVGSAQPRIHAVALDAAGDRLVATTRDGLVVVADQGGSTTLTGSSTGSTGGDAGFSFEGPAYTVTMSPDGREVAAAGSPPGIARWRHERDGWHLDGLIARDVVTMGLAVRWSDGLVATASNDGIVSLWDADGEHRWSADARPALPVASSVAFSPDGRTLAAGYHDGSVRVWELTDGEPSERPLGSAAFATWVNDVAFSPDGVLLAAASSDGSVRLWDTGTWLELRIELRHPSVVSGAQFLADRWLVTSSEDGIIRTWDVSSAVTGSDASIWAARFDGAGSTLVTASRTMLSIERRVDGDRTLRQVPAPADLQLFSGVCDVTDDGALVVAGTRSGAVVLLDAATGERLLALHGDLGQLVEGVVIVGDTVAAIDSRGRLHRWRLRRAGRSSGVPVLDVTGSDGCAVSSGTALAVVDFGDGLVGITTEPGELVVVDIGQPEGIVERARFRPGEAFPIGAARRPGHAMIATGGSDRAVSIWSVDDWDHPELVERLVGPAGHVMAIDIDRSGTRLAAGTTDGRIWIWEWCGDRLERWATIETGEAGVYAVGFSPDGRHLVSAGPNQRVTWWPLDVTAATELVRGRIGDPLTDAERTRLMPTRPG